MKKWKAFLPDALNLLLSKISQASKAVDEVKSTADSLGEDLIELGHRAAIDLAGKADKAAVFSCVIPKTGWAEDQTKGYPYYLDISAEGLTPKDRAKIILGVSSLSTAKYCGLCPTCETRDNILRIRSFSVPDEAMNAECHIESGEEQ